MHRFILNAASIPAVILAGGRSSRMGGNKGLVLLGGRTLLSRIAARIAPQARAVALNAEAGWPEPQGLRLVPDTVAGRAGPLAGVLAAMLDTRRRHPDATHVATVPIDSPFFPADLVGRLADAIAGPDEVAIAISQSRDHPVFGLWPVSVAEDLDLWLARDEKRRMRDFLLRHAAVEVDFAAVETCLGPLDPFFNINTPEDLEKAGQWLEALEP